MSTSPPNRKKDKNSNVHPVHSKKNAEQDFKSQVTRGHEVWWVPRGLGQ